MRQKLFRLSHYARSVNSRDALCVSLFPFLPFLLASRMHRRLMMFNIKPDGSGRGPTRPVALINERHQLLITHLVRNCNPQRNRTISRTEFVALQGRAIRASGMITKRDVVLYEDPASRECFANISKRNVALIARIKKS